MLCAAGVLANDVSTPGSMVLSFIPALLLRRRSAFPRALVPNAAFGLARTRRWPIRRASANVLSRRFVGADLQGRAEATRALAWKQSQRHDVACQFDPRHCAVKTASRPVSDARLGGGRFATGPSLTTYICVILGCAEANAGPNCNQRWCDPRRRYVWHAR